MREVAANLLKLTIEGCYDTGVVLKVHANARQIDHNRDIRFLEDLRRSDTTPLKNLWAV